MTIAEKAKALIQEMIKEGKITSISLRDNDLESIHSCDSLQPIIRSRQKYICEISYHNKIYEGMIRVEAYGDINLYRGIYKILTFIKKQL